MNPVEQLLRREMGLDPASLGSSTLERIARTRMKSLGLKSLTEYHRLLESSATERLELVESVVVTETWFYRDREAFTAFLQLSQQWLSEHPAGALRILSIPCATGEEPYTLAMCLLDAGVPRERFVIDAVDISARAVARAIAGVYGKNSFRGKDHGFRDRNFHSTKDGFALNDTVRECVHFYRDNLLNPVFLNGHEPYHFVFCRNLLIYFDRATQMKSLDRLRFRLHSDGLMFVGAAELPIFLENGFVSADVPMSFACRRNGSNGTVSRTARRKNAPKRSIIPPARTALTPPQVAFRVSANSTRDHKPDPNESESDLETARKLADAGKFNEAIELCHARLLEHGPSAPAYYLIGLVHDAGGDARANEFYRKALYLDPDHYEALWHLALLLERNGEHDEAAALKRRAQRAQAPGAKSRPKQT